MTTGAARQRARAHGLEFGALDPGEHNGITDVTGVRVGNVTLFSGSGHHAVRTGVTTIVPHDGNVFTDKLPAAAHVINGHGKPTGFAQVCELGMLETPVVMTSTLSVGDAFRGLVLDAVRRNPELRSVNPIVLECNDSHLSDARSLPVTAEHILQAIDIASDGPVAEGNVGAGTGMASFGWKSGIGTASRTASCRSQRGTVGVLVLSNFGYAFDLVIAGCQVGRRIDPPASCDSRYPAGSFVATVATDFALDARQLGRVARRVQNGIARVGGYVGNTSGEFVVAFSAARQLNRSSAVSDDDDGLDVLFHAVVDATEEAIVDSLFCASAVTGLGGRTVPELPVEAVIAMLRRQDELPKPPGSSLTARDA